MSAAEPPSAGGHNAEYVREITKPEGCVLGDNQCLGFPDGCAEIMYCAVDHLLKQAGIEVGFGMVTVGRVPYRGYVICLSPTTERQCG